MAREEGFYRPVMTIASRFVAGSFGLYTLFSITASPIALAQGTPMQGGGVTSQLELQQSDAGRALADAMAALGRNPRDLSALFIAGEAALKLDDPRSAIGFFGRADDVSPNNGRVKAGLGRSMLAMEQVGDGLRLMEQAETLGYSDTTLLVDRALARDLTGNQAGAQRDYQEALRRDPKNELAQRRYAVSLGISGHLEEAERILDPILRTNDRAAWRDRAFIFAMNGRTKDALDITRKTMPSALNDAIKPYMERMSMLTPGQRAAAVHMGQFPAGLVNVRVASTAAPAPATPTPTVTAAARKPVRQARAETPQTNAQTSVEATRRNRQARGSRQIEHVVPSSSSSVAVASAAPVASQPAAAPVASQPAAAAVTSQSAAAARPVTAQPSAPQQVAAAPASPRPPVASAPNSAAVPAFGPATSMMPPPVETRTATRTETVPVTTSPPQATDVAQAPSAAVQPAVPASVASPAIAAASPRPIQGPPAPDVMGAPTSSSLSAQSPSPSAPVPSSSASAPAAAPSSGSDAAESTRTLADIMAEIKVPEEERQHDVTPVNLAEIAALQAQQRKEREAAAAAARKEREAQEAVRRKAEAEAKAKAEAKLKADAEKKRLAANPARYWVQIGAGRDINAMGFTLRGMKKDHAVLAKYDGWSADYGRTSRLVVGPFPSLAKAKEIETAMKKGGSDAFVWRSEAGEDVTRLGSK